ncbi:MAG: cation-transporting P-type ATPase, partial [Methanobrevibacter sp.]|nr:cation-transporting P-type ATPase [Methanobrevibacter sp.]
MKFSRDEKKDILLIMISAISLITSFFLSLDILAYVAVALCGIPIFKECAEGLITEFDIKADLLVTIAIIASI